ncbi:ABC transporter G family member 35-like [Olea europaea var. sylvestris]|uniref:ABC transporter G family member 35-like n=1 Tax=Olea europaea var. sylvestris TaxID=158386 RepID=UPI000C1D75A1|nr:ABC transporter G family member 35-like [Olea europaea var. sylvestris]
MDDKMRASRRQTSRSMSRSIGRSLSRANWNVEDVFSGSTNRRSARAEEDEEALRWAALEKLPTYDRLRKTVLKSFEETANQASKVVHKEVDVRKLDMNDRQEFIDRLFKVAEEDNEKFLRKFRNRIDRVGITLPTVEVRYEHLTVEADCFVGDRALPTLPNAARNIVETALTCFGIRLAEKTKLTILKDASGIIKPSRMTLLLGPPSSGKTTLLLALAGKLDPTLKTRGEITYNGHQLNEFVPQKTSAYISQNDIHVGEMTVKETLDFSARCQGVGSRYELLTELAKRERDAGIFPEAEVDLFMKATAIEGVESSLITDYTLRILGLDMCRDTIVGDEMIRGISGGQKKRVTTGEMIVGPTKTLFMDEISTGLDSSTTFQIVKCLQQIVHLTEATVLMSLLQPAPETFELFDDIILLSEGQIVYQGPREHVLEFFESCGFKCPERKGTADFLQEVTSRKDQEQYWTDRSKPYTYIPVSEFAKRFKHFHVGLRLENELSVPYDKSRSHKAALVFKKYSVPTRELLKANFDKEWLLIKRNSFVYVFKTVQIIIVAIITSTVFLRTELHTRNENDGAVYIGALLFSMICNTFNGFSELSLAIQRLPVFYKQRDLLFHPPWAFTLPTILLKIPISIFETIVWMVIAYYTIGFAPEASRFFKQLLLIFVIQQMAGGIFRFTAAICRTMIISNTGGALTLLLVFLLGGFILPREKIPVWWRWGYWVSPLSYGYNAIAVNEMFAPRWMNKMVKFYTFPSTFVSFGLLRNKALVKELSTPPPGAKDLYFPTQYSQATWGQFKSCLWKQWWTYWRTPDYNLVRYFFTLACALMVGTIFWRVGTKRESSADLLTIIGAMYTSVLFVGINNCSTVQPIVAIERTVFYRERAAGMYSALPYAIAQVIVEIPYVLVQTTYYTLIVYAMVSFQWTAAKFFWFFFVNFFSFLYFTYYGMMTVSITPNHQVAAIFAAAFYALFNLFSGFFIPRPSIPKWWVWYYWICPVAWTVYGLIIGQYGDMEETITVPGMSSAPMIKNYIQDHFGYDPNFKGPVAAVLVGFTVFFAFLFAYCIKKLNFQMR